MVTSRTFFVTLCLTNPEEPKTSRRDAKIVEIYEGAKEIEKLVIGRQLIKGKVLY